MLPGQWLRPRSSLHLIRWETPLQVVGKQCLADAKTSKPPHQDLLRPRLDQTDRQGPVRARARPLQPLPAACFSLSGPVLQVLPLLGGVLASSPALL